MDALNDVDRQPIAWREAVPDGRVVGEPADEPIVFLHGLGGSRVAWDPQLSFLARHGHRSVAWDMPGYGASGAPRTATGELTFDGLADAVDAWVDELGATRVHLVGLSFGGMVAQHVALRFPQRLRTLTLIDTSPAFGFDGTTTAEEWVDQRLAPMRTGATPADFAAAVIGSIMAPTASASALQAGVDAMSRISAGGLAAAVQCLVTHDLRHRLHEIAAPTLVMVGEHDVETPLPYAQFLADTIPGARLEVIRGAGHISNLEAPEAVNEQLLAFVGG